MARLAGSFSCAILELATVRFCVAGLAIHRRALELDFLRTDGNLVACATGDSAMGSEKRELRLRVVEAAYIGPGLRVMASFAAKAHSVGAFAFHPVFELAMMRVGMASSAGHIVKAERQDFVGAMRFSGSMATGARNSGVCTGERETRFAMLCNRVKSAMKIDDGVARFAAVVVGSCGELVVVDVFVAVGTIRELDFVLRVFPCRRMTLRAFDRDMLTL